MKILWQWQLCIWRWLEGWGKTKTDLKKIVFDINVDDNEITDLNDRDAIQLKDGQADDNNTDIEDSGVQNN